MCTDVAAVVETYEFAIKEVLLNHNDVDSLWILEGEEAEPTRAASGAITHNLAVNDIAIL